MDNEPKENRSDGGSPAHARLGGRLYVVERWTMTKDSICAAAAALRVGIDNTRELLSDHDVRLGRTTKSNRLTAERLETEIIQIESALDGITAPFEFERETQRLEGE